MEFKTIFRHCHVIVLGTVMLYFKATLMNLNSLAEN